MAENTPLTGYEPNILDDFHYSEIAEIFFRDESSDTVPSYLFDAELDDEVQKFMNTMSDPAQFQGRIIFMSWGSEDNERECNANADLVSIFAKRFPAGRWSFLGPGSEKKWCSTHVDRPQEDWDRVAESMMMRFGERPAMFRLLLMRGAVTTRTLVATVVCWRQTRNLAPPRRGNGVKSSRLKSTA